MEGDSQMERGGYPRWKGWDSSDGRGRIAQMEGMG